jgi:hypothetical protein
MNLIRINTIILLSFVWAFVLVIDPSESVILTPPYFNLVSNRHVSATATCGEGVTEPELYCKLTGTAADRENSDNTNLIQVTPNLKLK